MEATQERKRTKRQEEEIDLLELLRALLQKFYWLLLAAAFCGLGAFLITHFLIAPTYESTASFYVYTKTEDVNATGVSGNIQSGDLQAAESLAGTYTSIMESNSVLDAALEQLHQNGTDTALTRKELSEMVEVSVVTDTQLIKLTVTSTDPKQACRIAQALIQVAPTEIIRITKAGGIEVVDRPEVPKEKASPNTVKNTALGALLGIVLAAALVILKSLTSSTIYLPEDLEKIDGVTVLGQIPVIGAEEQNTGTWTTARQGVIRYE